MDVEQWKTVNRDPNFMVSDLGRIKSKDRWVRCRHGNRLAPGMILKTPIGSTGYPHVSLSGRRIVSVHVLVAEAFIPNPGRKPNVNHINCDRSDPRAVNLEWVTPSENQLHRYRTGGKGTCLGKMSADHPTSKAVISTNMATGKETRYECALDAVRLGVGFDSASISRCCNGINAYHKGHYWRFADDVALNDQEREVV